jgi:hypothetical protein
MEMNHSICSTNIFQNLLLLFYNSQAEFPALRRPGGWFLFFSTYGSQNLKPLLRSRQLCSYSRTSQNFMEPEVSLPPLQEPSTGPYPEPD